MRGYVFMLESVFASIILVGFLLYLAQGYTHSRSVPEQDFGGVLPGLDEAGLLRGPALSGDFHSIEDEISIYGFSHSVQLCDASGSCLGEKPVAESVRAYGYFIAGDDSYSPMEVRLYVWEA